MTTPSMTGPASAYPRPVRITRAMTVTLQALAGQELTGRELMNVTGLRSGTIYPLLGRLEAGGLVGGEWRDVPHRGTARQRFYWLTVMGREMTGTLPALTRTELL